MKRIVLKAFLEKLARHLLLLACLVILSKAAGWTNVDQISIFLLIILGFLVHWGARAINGFRSERFHQ